jgi:hypothetical protein
MQTRIFQNAVLMTLTAILCCANVLAQSADEAEKIITFDKLQKTIIPLLFPCSQPIVKIETNLAGYKLETINRKRALVFDKPVPAGVYTITLTSGGLSENIDVKIEPNLAGYKLETVNGECALVFDKPVAAGVYAITLTRGGLTENIEWRVLTTALDPKSMPSLASMKLYHSKRLSLRATLPREAEIPLQQFKIDYQIDNDAPVQNNAFSESWSGPYIPASARIVKAAVVWIYPITGERVILWQREIEPQQE